MKLYAGIDGGQTATQAVVGDDAGTILGRGRSGPADEVGVTADSTRLRDALAGALRAATLDAGLGDDTMFETIVAGISGYEGRVYGVIPAMPARNLVLMHDAPIAHAGALNGGPGVVVVAGTGTVAYASDANGTGRTVGGFGYVFGDEGSAFWIASRALGNVALHDECSHLEAVTTIFGTSSMRALFRSFYSGDISRERIGAFAPVCIAAAHTAPSCSCLVAPANAAIGELAALAAAAGGAKYRDLAFVGGLMNDAWFKERVYDAAQTSIDGVRIVEPQYEPAIGALLLARRT